MFWRAPKLKRVESTLPVTIRAASFLLTPSHDPTGRVALSGREYSLYAISEDGHYERMKRVKSFTFSVDAGTGAPAKCVIEYFDHDPRKDV